MTGALLDITPRGDPRSDGHGQEPFTYRLVEERVVAPEVAPPASPVRRSVWGAAFFGAAFKLLAFWVGFTAMIWNFCAGVGMVIALVLAVCVLVLSLISHIWVWHLWLFVGVAFALYVSIGLMTMLEARLKRAAGLVA